MSDGWGTGNGFGGPQAGGTNGGGSGPDWAALADQHERDTRRRRQLRVVGGAVAAVLVVGGITALAVSRSGAPGTAPAAGAAGGPSAATTGAAAAGGGTEPVDVSAAPGSPSGAPASTPTGSAAASAPPSAPGSGKAAPNASAGAPADPLTVISSASTDTAPLDPAALFADRLTVGGRTWTRLTTATTSPCWKATTGGLGDVLAAQGCRAMLRATYTSGSSAVTVGIAVMDTRAQADAAAAGHHGQVQGLVPAGQTSWCTSAGCANTHGTVGRYGYYTVAGTVRPGGNTADATATAAQSAFASYARGQLLARGRR